ncbi:hypothetical protein OXX59_003893 [Metschnikowia pulcherrima]
MSSRSKQGPGQPSRASFSASRRTLQNAEFASSSPSKTSQNSPSSSFSSRKGALMQHSSSGDRRDSSHYDEHVSLLNPGSQNVDYKSVSKHLANPQDALKMPGGDVSRYMHQQITNSARSSDDRRLTRSSSFSDFLSEQRRESTASDINVPGGFRREFIIHKNLRQNKAPPNFLTRNFVEFLSIYGQFAGENFDDDSDTETDDDSRYEDVFDEEASLMHERGIPSLPKKQRKREQPKGTASFVKTFFLLFKALVGSGILFLPRAFCNGGLLFSTITMSLFGVLTYLCYIILIQSKKILGKSSYGELGYLTHGKPLKYFIMVSIIISQVGFVATYVLFTAENMTSFLESFFDIRLNKSTMFLVQCLLLIPLALIRDLAKLSFTSFTSSLFILVGLVIIFYFSGLQLIHEGLGPNITNFNSSTWSMLIGVAVTSFEGIGLILPIEASMARPEKFPLVLSISMAAITALFVLIGVVGYSAYGEHVRSIIILNLPQSNAAVQSILVLYSIAVFLTGPLQLFPAIRIGESVIFNSRLFLSKEHRHTSEEGRLYRTSGKYNPHIKWMKNLFRTAVVIIITVLAWVNADNIDKFVSFNGCFACIPLVYIYPPLIHLKTYEKNSRQSRLLKMFDYVLIVVGVVAVVYTTYQILFAI